VHTRHLELINVNILHIFFNVFSFTGKTEMSYYFYPIPVPLPPFFFPSLPPRSNLHYAESAEVSYSLAIHPWPLNESRFFLQFMDGYMYVVSTDGEGYGLSCAPLKDILSPNSQYFRM
jgi:hypothetical protein